MRIPESRQFTCEVCGRQKNGEPWLIGFVTSHLGIERVALSPWQASLAKLAGAHHFCGVQHGLQWVGRELEKFKPEVTNA